MISFKYLSNRLRSPGGARTNSSVLLLVTFAVTLFSCGTTADPTARVQADEVQLAQASTDNGAALRRGKILFLQCRACHSTEAAGEHRVGPNLHGLFGAEAASKPGFAYSEALSQAGVTWSADTLSRFLTEPSAFVPGTIMAFAGLPQESDRDALIAYLAEQTK